MAYMNQMNTNSTNKAIINDAKFNIGRSVFLHTRKYLLKNKNITLYEHMKDVLINFQH